jgi:hypothetical protein
MDFLKHFRLFETILGRFEPFWIIQYLSGLFQAVLDNFIPFQTISDPFGSFGITSGHFGPFQIFSDFKTISDGFG